MALTRAVAKTITVKVTDFGVKEDKMPRQWGETVQGEDDRSPPLPAHEGEEEIIKERKFQNIISAL